MDASHSTKLPRKRGSRRIIAATPNSGRITRSTTYWSRLQCCCEPRDHPGQGGPGVIGTRTASHQMAMRHPAIDAIFNGRFFHKRCVRLETFVHLLRTRNLFRCRFSSCLVAMVHLCVRAMTSKPLRLSSRRALPQRKLLDEQEIRVRGMLRRCRYESHHAP
jgi:hypothetical protein